MTEDATTTYTLLGSGREIAPDEFGELYAYPADLDRCRVRANMIASLDGAATLDDRSGGLAGPGDRALFSAMREAADVILVGAGTVRAENYSGAQLSVTTRQQRQARGQREVPPIAVVTASGDIDPASRLLTHTETPPLIYTTRDSFAATRDRLHGAADVVDASSADSSTLDIAAVLADLARRRLLRVLCEGGPSLLDKMVADDALDELGLTIAPMLVGGRAPRILSGQAPVRDEMRVRHIVTDSDGYLYTLFARP